MEIRKIGENRETYLSVLTKSDLIEIAKRCFDAEQSPHHAYVDSSNILLVYEDEREYTLHEYYLLRGWRSPMLENAEDEYIHFMYEKFGEEYLYKYFSRKYRLDSLLEEMREAQVKYNDAKIHCDDEMEKFKSEHKEKNYE